MTTPTRLILVFAAILALHSGCGDDDSDSGPSDRQVSLVQSSASASGAVGQVVEAANSEIVFGGSGSPPPGSGDPPEFNFSASVDVVVDLDSLDAFGNDRFPNATGQVHVVASGTVTGTSLSGEASYSVAVAAETDVIVTNPETQEQVLIPAESSWSYQLDITWNVTDANNWTVTATAASQVGVTDMTVIDGGTVKSIDLEGQRQVDATLARTAGTLTFQRSVEGSLAITVDDGISVANVDIVFDGAGQVTVSVEGQVFGPMSEAEARALFKASIN
ncbi:MAG TPA: hypothetical protein VFC90_01215 [Planctomycetota bacterium]|nr:hypothetical protein [Planctomycetota bacterium]